MFNNDIDVIRAVQTDRINRDVRSARAAGEQASADLALLARRRSDLPDVTPRATPFRMARRSIGRSIVRIGTRIAADSASPRLHRGARPDSTPGSGRRTFPLRSSLP